MRTALRIVFLFLGLGMGQGTFAAEVSKELQLKAVFLFRLAQFVDWPTNVFESETSPIVIGVLGEDPMGESLDLAVRGETAHNRPLMVQRYRRVEEVKNCHILFISRSETSRIKEILNALANRSILTVSDIEGFVADQNGMIRFVTDSNKVKLRIDPERAKSAGLILNSRLLRMAEIVKKP